MLVKAEKSPIEQEKQASITLGERMIRYFTVYYKLTLTQGGTAVGFNI